MMAVQASGLDGLLAVGADSGQWQEVTLRDVASFSSGTTPSRARHADFFEFGRHPWVKTMDLNNSLVEVTDECITDRALTETSLKVQPAGSVLVAMYGGFQQIGRTGLLIKPAAVNQAITAISTNRQKLLPEYLLYVLNYRVEYWKTVASSSRKDPNITSGDVKAFPITLPGIAEQRVISDVLTDVDQLDARLSILIAKKRAIKQGLMRQLLTGENRLPGFTEPWKPCRLSDVLSYEQPGPFLVHTTRQLESGRTPVLTAGKTFVLGYTNETAGVYVAHPVIIFDDFTTASKYVDFAFKAKSSAMKILSARAGVDLRFIYERMQLIDFPLGDHKRYWISEYGKQEVLMPGEGEQKAISQIVADVDDELVHLGMRLEKVKAIKLGMMQGLLTGRTRLPAMEAAV